MKVGKRFRARGIAACLSTSALLIGAGANAQEPAAPAAVPPAPPARPAFRPSNLSPETHPHTRGGRRLVCVSDSRGDRSAPTPAEAPSQPTWPLTLLIVVVAGLLSAWNLYGALILTAPFFGDVPSRGQYVEAAAVAVAGDMSRSLLETLRSQTA